MRLSNIALYDKNTTDFFDQGLGILSDAISSESTEEVQDNGNITYEMVLKYPIGGVLSDQLKLPNLIRAQESEDPNDFMIFEIYDYDEDDEGEMTVYAQAMPYRVLRLPFNDDSKFPTKYNNIQELMDYAVSRVTGFPSWFKITSDIIVANNLSFDAGNAQFENLGKFLDATLSLIDASVEYKWNRINILDSRGRDLSDIVLRDDKNTNGIKITGSYEKIINKVVPIIRNRNETTGEFEDGTHMGSVVTSKDPFKWIPYYSGVTATFDSQEEANNYISSNKLDNPAITVDVSPLMVDEDLTQVHTFDRITAYSTKLKYQDTLQVTTRVFDQLNAEVVSFKMGSIKKDINSTTSYTLSSLASEIARAQNIAGGAARSADGKNTVNFGENNPTNPVEGDLWSHKIDGKDVIQQYINGEWSTIVKDRMGEEIRSYVDQKMLENNEAMDKLNSDLESNTKIITANKKAVDDAMSKVNEDLTQAKSNSEKAAKDADQAVASAKSAVEASELSAISAQAASEATNAAKASATQAASDLATAKNAANDAEDDASAALEAANGASLTANTASQDVDSIKGTIKTLATTETVNAIKGKVTKATTDIETIGGQMKQVYTKSETTNLLTPYATQTWAQNQITSTANTWSTQLSSVQTQVGNIGQKNLVYNSELISSTNGWTTNSNITVGNNQYDHYNGSNSLAIHENTMALGDWHYVYSKPIAVVEGNVYSASATLFVTGPSTLIATNVYLTIDFFDTNGKRIDHTDAKFDVTNYWAKQYLKVENKVAPTSAVTMCLAIWFNGQINLIVNHPMLVAASSVGPYQPSSASDTELAGSIVRIGKLEATSTDYEQRLTKTTETANTANGTIESVKADVNSYTQQLATFQQSLNNLGQTNLVDDSEFEGFTSNSELYISRAVWPDGIVPHLVFNRVGKTDWTGWQSNWVTIDDMSQQYSASMSVIGASATSCLTIEFGDDKGNRTSAHDNYFDTKGAEVQLLKVQGVKPDANAKMVRLNWNVYGNGHIAMREPMLVAAPIVGPYVSSRVTIKAFNTIKSTVNGTVQTIADIENKKLVTINNSIDGLQKTVKGKASQTQFTQLDSQLTSVASGLGQKNYIYNSEFANSGDGWTMPDHWIAPTSSGHDQYKGSYGIRYGAGGGIVDDTVYSAAYAKPVPVAAGQVWSGSVVAFVTGAPLASVAVTGSAYLELWYLDKNKAMMTSGATTVRVSTPPLLPADAYNKATLKVENFPVPTDAAYIMFRLVVHGSGNVIFCQPMLTTFASVGSYQPDTVGNSQITQLQKMIDLRVNVDGKIAAALNLSADGGGTVTIRGASLYVTAASHFDDASIKSASIASLDATKITSGSISSDRLATTKLNADNITSGSISADRLATTKLNADNITSGSIDASLITTGKLSADRIHGGTLDGYRMDIVNINANSITAGTINGSNLAINLTSGDVKFQSGRIHDRLNHVDINIDPHGFNSYLSVANGDNRVLLKGGELQFIQPQLFDLQKTPYLSISNQGSGSNWAGATFVGRDSVVVANSANVGSSILTWELGKNDFAGLMAGKNSDGHWEPTILGGAERGVIIVGGPLDDGKVQSSPFIRVGASTDGYSVGNRIYMHAAYIIAPAIYTKTTGSSSNVVVLNDGSLHRSTSASKYKTMIERSRSTRMAEALIALPTAHWLDKAEIKNYENGEQKQSPKQYFGMIAEDLAGAGLEELVQRGDDGELEGINYDRIAPALLPLLAKMKQEIEELKGE